MNCRSTGTLRTRTRRTGTPGRSYRRQSGHQNRGGAEVFTSRRGVQPVAEIVKLGAATVAQTVLTGWHLVEVAAGLAPEAGAGHGPSLSDCVDSSNAQRRSSTSVTLRQRRTMRSEEHT